MSRISNSATILRNTRSARSSKSVRAVSPRAVRVPVCACVCWRQSPRQPCDVVSVPADATCAAGRVVKQDEGGFASRLLPHQGRMGVYWRSPPAGATSPTAPPSPSPPGEPGRLCDREIPHGRTRGGARRGGETL